MRKLILAIISVLILFGLETISEGHRLKNGPKGGEHSSVDELPGWSKARLDEIRIIRLPEDIRNSDKVKDGYGYTQNSTHHTIKGDHITGGIHYHTHSELWMWEWENRDETENPAGIHRHQYGHEHGNYEYHSHLITHHNNHSDIENQDHKISHESNHTKNGNLIPKELKTQIHEDDFQELHKNVLTKEHSHTYTHTHDGYKSHSHEYKHSRHDNPKDGHGTNNRGLEYEDPNRYYRRNGAEPYQNHIMYEEDHLSEGKQTYKTIHEKAKIIIAEIDYTHSHSHSHVIDFNDRRKYVEHSHGSTTYIDDEPHPHSHSDPNPISNPNHSHTDFDNDNIFGSKLHAYFRNSDHRGVSIEGQENTQQPPNNNPQPPNNNPQPPNNNPQPNPQPTPQPTNRPPQFLNTNLISDIITTVGNTIQSTALPGATDPENNNLSYSIDSSPTADWLALNSNRQIIGTPQSTGIYTITYKVTDGTNTVNYPSTFTITVNSKSTQEPPVEETPIDPPVNQPPQFSTTYLDTVITAQQSVIIRLPSATDPENDPITYSILTLPEGLIFSSSDRTITGIAQNQSPRTAYTYTATAGGQNHQIEIYITINPPVEETVVDPPINNPPEFSVNSISDIVGTVGQSLDPRILPIAMDAERDSISYSVSSLPSGLSFDPSTRTISGIPQSASRSLHTYIARAVGGTDILTFYITINAAPKPDPVDPPIDNTPPIEETDEDQIIDQTPVDPPIDQPIDPPQEHVNYSPYFNEGSSASRYIDENTGSGVNIGSPILATDLDNDTLTYSLSGVDASSFSIDGSTGQLLTYTALDYETKNSYIVVVYAFDDRGGSGSITVTINVTDVYEPIVDPDQQTSEIDYTTIPFDYNREGVGKIVISEIMMARLNKYPQWIELYNTTDQDIDIKGWRIASRYLDNETYNRKKVSILKYYVISDPLIIKSKDTALIVNFATPNSRDRVARGLEDKVYALGKYNNLWNYEGIVLQLQDPYNNPIDRIGNMDELDNITWEMPEVVRDERVSLIRRLKSMRSQEYNFAFGMEKLGWFPANKVKELSEKRNKYYYGRYTDIGSPGYRVEDSPLPVQLSQFQAELQGDIVVITWSTESEINNAGFNILRSTSSDGIFKRVNPKLIAGAGTISHRTNYTFEDKTADAGVVYYYQIEEVSFEGVSEVIATRAIKGVFSPSGKKVTLWGSIKTN